MVIELHKDLYIMVENGIMKRCLTNGNITVLHENDKYTHLSFEEDGTVVVLYSVYTKEIFKFSLITGKYEESYLFEVSLQ